MEKSKSDFLSNICDDCINRYRKNECDLYDRGRFIPHYTEQGEFKITWVRVECNHYKKKGKKEMEFEDFSS